MFGISGRYGNPILGSSKKFVSQISLLAFEKRKKNQTVAFATVLDFNLWLLTRHTCAYNQNKVFSRIVILNFLGQGWVK